MRALIFMIFRQVLNAASDLFIQVFEDRGTHARSAVGVANLPLNSAVELERNHSNRMKPFLKLLAVILIISLVSAFLSPILFKFLSV